MKKPIFYIRKGAPLVSATSKPKELVAMTDIPVLKSWGQPDPSLIVVETTSHQFFTVETGQGFLVPA